MDIDGLQGAERALDAGEALVGADRRGIVERLLWQAGTHDVDAVERCLGGDRGGLAMEREARVGDDEIEVLGHLVAVDDGADLERDLGLAAQRLARAPDGGGDDGEIDFGRGQQILALAGALAREIGIATDDEPFARIIRRRDGRHVALVKQRHLQSARFDQRSDRWRAQGRDPIEPGGNDILGSRRACVIIPRSPTSTT